MRWRIRRSLIERLAAETGYLVMDRDGDYYRLRAEDAAPQRAFGVRCREDGPFATFQAVFPVRWPISATTLELTRSLLLRNRELFFGQWCLDVQGACELVPFLSYAALKSGLSPAIFKLIAEEMVEERVAVHQLLRDQLMGLGQGRSLARYLP